MRNRKTSVTQWTRILRSVLCFALILTLALGNVVPLKVAKAEGEDASGEGTNEPASTDLLNVDFSGTLAEVSSKLKWTGSDPSTANLTYELKGESNQYLRLTSSSTSNNLNVSFFGNVNSDAIANQVVVYEYMLSAEASETDASATTLPSQFKAFVYYESGAQALIYARGGGKLWRNNSVSGYEAFGTITSGAWTKIAVVVDYANPVDGKYPYKVYVDDVYVKSYDGACEGYTVETNSGNHYTLKPYGVSFPKKSGTVLVDNIRVYIADDPDIKIVSAGTTSSYTKGSGNTVTIQSTGDMKGLESIKIGSETIAASNYTVQEGNESTAIITFNESYIESLAEGTYTITLTYSGNRVVTSQLTIENDVKPVSIIADETSTSYRRLSNALTTIACDGAAKDLMGVDVNGVALDADRDYSVDGDDTTTVILSSTYLDALSVGEYIVTLQYSYEREAASELEILQPVATKKDIVNLDFEGEWAEFAEALDVDNPTARVMQIADPVNPLNKCLKLKHLGDGTKVTVGYVGAEGDVTGKQVVYEYKISFISGEAISNKAHLFTNYPNVTPHLRAYSDGTIKLDGESEAAVTLIAGEWTKIAMVIDYAAATETTTGTYKIYVNGVCVKSDGEISNLDTAGTNRGTQAYLRVRLSNAGHILMDDLRIYEGSEPLDEYLPAEDTVTLNTAATTTSYEKNTGAFVTVKTDGLKSELQSVQVNGTALDVSNYSLSDTMTTTVTLKNSYLNDLEIGTYKVKLVYTDDRFVETDLVVTAADISVLEGTSDSYAQASDDTVTVLTDGLADELQKVTIGKNGEQATELVLDTDYAVIGADDTSVVIAAATLKKLLAGDYTITLVYTDNRELTVPLTVTPATISLVTDGTTTFYQQKIGDTVTVKTDGYAAELQSVLIGEAVLVKDTDYIVSGEYTTTVVIANSYLDALKDGVHTITLQYAGDRSVTSELTVKKPTALKADIVNLDFDGEWAEFAYALGVAAPNANVMQIVDPANPDNKVLKITCIDDVVFVGNVNADGDVAGKSIVYEYRVGTLERDDISNAANLFCGDPIIANRVRWDRHYGWIKVGGEKIVSLNDKQWAKVAMVINYADATETTTGTYKIYVNDALVGSGTISNLDGSKDKGVQNFMGIRLSNPGHILIDDWRIYEGSEPLAEYIPAAGGEVSLISAATTTSYMKETDVFVTVKATGLKSELQSVKVDGNIVDSVNYVVTGTTASTVTFKNSYLDTLSVGDHEVTLAYSGDREVVTTLKVNPKNVAVLDGTTESFVQNSDGDVTILTDGAADELLKVTFGETELAKGTDYMVSGTDTTTITIKNDVVKGLLVNSYSITLDYAYDRTITSTLNVTPGAIEIVTDGTVTSYLQRNGETVTIRTNGFAAELQSVLIGTKTLKKDTDYTVSGTTETIITLANDCLDGLKVGDHTITLNYAGERVLTSSLNVTEKAATKEDIVNLDFEAAWSEFAKAIDVDNPTAYVTQIIDPSNPANKALKITSTGNKVTIGYVGAEGDVTGKQIVYEYKISAIPGEAISNNANLFTNHPIVTTHLRLYSTGSIKLAGQDDAVATLVAGEWTRIAMVINYADATETTTGTYKIYVNGVCVKDDGVISNISADVDRGTQNYVRVRLSNAGHILIDDWRIYEGSEPMAEYVGASDGKAELDVDGTITSYQKETGELVTIRSTGAKVDFVGVKVNNVELAADNYIVSETTVDTVVTLKNTYLDTLTSGEYEFSLMFAGGTTVKSALDVQPAVVEIIADGTTTTYEKGKDTVAAIKAGRTYTDLLSVKAEGRLLSEGTDYTVTGDAETTTITFTAEWLNDCDARSYSIVLEYSELRTAASSLQVTFDPDNSELFVPDLLYLDFNGEWSSFGTFIGMETGASAYITQVTAPSNPENKYLQINNPDGLNTVQMTKLFTYFQSVTKYKEIVYEYEVSVPSTEAIPTVGRLFVGSSGTTYLYMRRGVINQKTDQNFATAVPGEWIKVALVVNHAAGTARAYVNDVCVRDTFSIPNGLIGIRINAGDTGAFLIDNLRIYEGNTPHVSGTAIPVGTDVYVDRTFDEIWKYDFEEFDVVRKSGSLAVVGTGNKYLKAAGTETPATMIYTTNADSNFIVAHAKLSVESATGNAADIFVGVGEDGKTITFLKLVGDSVQLPDGTEVVKLSAGTFTDVAVVADMNGSTYTVYENGQRLTGAVEIPITEVTELASIKTVVSEGSLLVDDLRVYDAKKPQMYWAENNTPDTIYVSESEAQAMIGNAVALQMAANTLYANGVKSEAVKAFEVTEDGKVYVALSDLQKLFEADLVLTGASEKNGAYDVIAVAEASGYTYSHKLDTRLLMFSKSAISLTATKEKEINKYMQFERPAAETVKDLFYQNVDTSVNGGHPRVLITQDDVTRLKNLYNSGEEYVKRWGDNAIAKAEKALTTPDFDYNHKPGDSMDHVDEAGPMILNLGMAYFLTDDEEAKAAYVAKAKSMVKVICELPDWNPLSYLDVGELSCILGIAYDWFYQEYTDEERAIIEKNLMEKGVGIQNKLYYGVLNREEVYWTWWDNTNNWNFVCNGGTMLGAIALFDVYPDVCAQVVANSLHGAEFMMDSYYPEGVWHEGGGYWNYSLKYVAYTMLTFGKVFNEDFGFLCTPGLSTTGWYGLKLSGSTGINNFGDAGTGFVNNRSLLWCADTFNDPELMAARLQEMERLGYAGEAGDLIFYNENLLGDTEAELSLDTSLDSMSVISLRERWYDRGATFLGISGMKPKSGHAHMDTGSFVVDMMGERIIIDVGADSYNSPGYFADSRYYYYRTRPEGHNVYIINPTGDRDDFGVTNSWATVTNTPIVTKDRGAFSTLDLTNVYASYVNSAIRGVMLTDDRRSALIRDEIDLKEASELYSYMHTKAMVEIDPENPNVAILTQNGTKFKVMIDVQGEEIENYTFKVVAAESRADYGVKDSANTGICKLEIYVKTKAAGKVNITMKVIGYNDPAADKALITTPIAQWSADMIPDGEVAEIPYVDMIYVNGEPVKGFDPVVTGYTARLSASALLPVVTATSEKYNRIEITQAEAFGEDYIVKVYDNEDDSLYRVYRLNYTKLPALKPVDGRVRYAVLNATASASPEADTYGWTPESAMDNDFTSSRWTSECNTNTDSHWLMFELNEVSDIHKIGLSFYNGHKRYYFFNLEVSVDGVNWTEVYEGWTMKQGDEEIRKMTSELQYFFESEEGIKAKYVRFTGKGNSVNLWNNITEFVILGAELAAESYELGGNNDVDLLINKKAEALTGITVDGNVLGADNYTAVSGNIGVVTLKFGYLETLAVGEHELVLNYQDGSRVKYTLVIEAAGEVTIIEEGTVGTYEIGSTDKVSVHCSGLMSDLIGVKVNDQLINPSNYDVTEGSTIVTFKEGYLESSGVGTHKITLIYSKGRSVNTWLVIAEAQIPGPGDITGGADETTEAGGGSAGGEGSAEAESTTGAGESTEVEESTEAETSTEAEDSTEVGTDAAPGGDPDTGDFAGTSRWMWLIVVEVIMMTGYALGFGFDRKKQK